MRDWNVIAKYQHWQSDEATQKISLVVNQNNDDNIVIIIIIITMTLRIIILAYSCFEYSMANIIVKDNLCQNNIKNKELFLC